MSVEGWVVLDLALLDVDLALTVTLCYLLTLSPYI